MQRFPTITADALESLKRRIGQPVPRPQPYVEVATRDAIRHWAHGIGDRNPLWSDPDYAAKSCRGGILAPPTILYAMDRIVSCSGTGRERPRCSCTPRMRERVGLPTASRFGSTTTVARPVFWRS